MWRKNCKKCDFLWHVMPYKIHLPLYIEVWEVYKYVEENGISS